MINAMTQPDPNLVLVVDDDMILRYLAREALEDAGFRVDDAADGAGALDRIIAERPDIVLLDVNMPVMDGFTLCTRLREMPATASLPVIMMTSSSDVAAINRAYEVGATDFITKPINWTILTQRIRYTLRASRAFETLRFSEAKLATAQRVAGLGYWELDLNSDTATLSGEAYHLLGLHQDAADIALEAFWNVVHPEDLGEVKRRRQAAIADYLPYRMDYRICLPDAVERTLHEQADILYGDSGQPERILGAIQDITDRKQSEAALLSGKEAAEQAVRVKNTFMANISHEIRTPINGIVGYLQLLDDLALPEEADTYINRALNSSTDLLGIVNQLLDFSSIEDDAPAPQLLDFELRTALDDIVTSLAGSAQLKGLDLTCLVQADVPIWVAGDPGGLRQVLTHLIDNAIKFTATGDITIRVQLLEYTQTEATLRFDVEDAGIGISPEAREGLFQPFFQEDDSATRRYGGTGLGLTIARSLVERMGGQISLESEPDVGSTFWFTLRLNTTPAPPQLATSEMLTLEGKRVLYVDDHATVRSRLQAQLETWGMTVETATDSDQAMAILQADGAPLYDLALLTHHLPDLDGIALSRRIRHDPTLSVTRLILLSRVGQRGHGEAAKRTGISAYLVQPVQPSQLFTCLGMVLSPHTPSTTLVTRHRVSEARAHRTTWVLVAAPVGKRQQAEVKLLQTLGYRVDVVSDHQVLVDVLSHRSYAYLLLDTSTPDIDALAVAAFIRSGKAGLNPSFPIIAVDSSASPESTMQWRQAGMDAVLQFPLQVEALIGVLASLEPGEKKVVSPQTGTQPGALPEDESFQWADIQSEYGRELAAELCQIFVAEMPDLIAELKEAQSQADVMAWERSVLRLQSGSASLGAKSLENLCRSMSLPPDFGSSNHLIEAIETEFQNFKQLVDDALS